MNIENNIVPFFIGTCPKCNSRDKFTVRDYTVNNKAEKIEHFIYDDWNEYNFFLFAISSVCPNCNQLISANIATQKENTSHEITEYCDSKGELINDRNLLIYFDYPPLLPNFIPTEENPFPVVDLKKLYEQAEHCYKVHAWESVCIICRKIIDIATTRIWERKYPGRVPDLHKRAIKLLLERESLDRNKEIEEQLDFNNEKHILFYDMNIVRTQGNQAAHGKIIYFADDAESSLIFTRTFIDEEFLNSF